MLCVKAEIPQPIGRDAASIAGPTKRRRRRRDNAHDLAARKFEGIGRSPSLCRKPFWGDPGSARQEAPDNGVARHDLFRRPARGAPDIHVLDETNLSAQPRRFVDESVNLAIIDPAQQHRVDFESREQLRGRFQSFADAGELVRPGETQGRFSD